jgi:hypothetical protein
MTKFGRVEVEEEVFRLGRDGRPFRPFKISAAVECRGYSRPLQRVMVDFGAEKSFDKAAQRIKEHYGIDVAQSAVRRETLHHAAAIKEQEEEERDCQLLPGPGAEVVIGEMDGSMVPIVDFIAPKEANGPKHRSLKWEEARLALAREVSSITPYYGATMGGVEESGEVLAACVRRAGGGKQTRLHCLGDGAKWIAQQVKDQFGEQSSYLLDFYHVSEYLAEAAQKMGGENSRQWLVEQKERLLGNRVEEVLLDLRSKEEAAEVREEEAPVRVCLRYLSNHRQYLDYEGARKSELPIGSGEVESGHRSVIQQRLKIAGAWWLRENAEKMIALRVARANNDWQSYWFNLRQAVA